MARQHKLGPDPMKAGRNGRPRIYPLPDMRPGDSFFAPLPASKKLHPVMSAVSQWRRRHPWQQWKTRAVVSHGVEGRRVWRLA